VSEGRRKAAPVRVRRRKHWALRVLGWLLALFFLGVIGVAAAFFIGYQTTKIPEPNKDFATNTTTVYYSDGNHVLGTFFKHNRRSVPLAQIPKTVQDAIIAAEDRTFWTNPGISPSGMARAAYNIARGQQLQGGSTITQQYVKIMYLTQERTFSRKITELFIATKLSRSQDKKSTLEGYMNTIYFGQGAYGIAAAGDAYFSVLEPKNLTVPQAAFLATVLNNPTRFDPDNPANRPRILQRYQYVLDGMRQTGSISDAQYKTYKRALPKLKKRDNGHRYAGTKGFLLSMARLELQKLGIPDEQISGGGLQVTTTFDWGLQTKAVRAASGTHPKKTKDLHIGLASVRPGTGELVAMYGGPDFLKSELNWATLRARPGSSFKPFAVAAALKEGRKLDMMLQGDSPILIQGQKLRNEFNTDYGPVDLLTATEKSVNTAFYDLVDAQMDHGPSKLVDTAEAAGIPMTADLERGRNNPATVLGPDPYASPVDMANAYATFAANGTYVPVHSLKIVKYMTGKTRWSDADLIKQGKDKPRIDPYIAKWVNFALQKVVESGTGKGAAALGHPVAGKTGTAGGVAVEHRGANSKCGGKKVCSDTLTSWWSGYTPELSTAVLYRAGKTGEGDLDKYIDKNSSDQAFFGGNWPVKTWLAYMEPALKNVPSKPFDNPTDVSNYNSPSPTYTPPTSPSSTPPTSPSSTPPTSPSSTPPTSPSSTPTDKPTGKPTQSPSITLPTGPGPQGAATPRTQ
jgi:membrane peptidoglycan carboxypeptidase